VDKALTCVFSKDRDFQYSPKTRQAKQLFLQCVCLRGEQWRIGGACKEVYSRGGVHGFYSGIEGEILHSISCRSKNGASHRKNCDTPPLIGNCPDTLVSRQIPMKTHDLEMNRYLERYRPWQLTEVPIWLTLTRSRNEFPGSCEAAHGALATSVPSSRQMRRRPSKRPRREREKLRANGRDPMLSSVVVGSHTQMEMHIFTELVGIQMLLMNTLEPLLRGDKIAQEQLTILFRQVQTTKATKAQELLAKRSQSKVK